MKDLTTEGMIKWIGFADKMPSKEWESIFFRFRGNEWIWLIDKPLPLLLIPA